MEQQSLKIGQYKKVKICSKCGYIFPDNESDTISQKEHQEKFNHVPYSMDVDEKISKAVSVLLSKGYYVYKSSQGGWGYGAEGKSKMPRFYIRFKMSPAKMAQFRSKQITKEALAIYGEMYWEWIGIMIESLPNAFVGSFVYEMKENTLPRASIRQAKPKARDLVIRWIPEINIRDLGDPQELETMIEYSYKKLEDWANSLPDINAIMMEKVGVKPYK